MNTNVKIFIGIIVLLVLGVVFTAFVRGGVPREVQAGQYDEFAQCLKDEGAIFYGAFWCKYCNAQKKMFESSARLLPYEECSTADGRGQLPACKEKGITGYPFWVFPDGTQETGVLTFEQLAEKTACALPGAEESPTE